MIGAVPKDAVEAEARIIEGLEAFAEGGPDLRREWRGLAAQWSLRRAWLEDLIADAEKDRVPQALPVPEEEPEGEEEPYREAAEVGDRAPWRRAKPKEEPVFIYPVLQPEAEEEPEQVEMGPPGEALFVEPVEVEPQEVEAEGRGSLLPYFADAGPDEDANPPVIYREAALDNARSFSRRHCWAGSRLGVVHWHGEFWRWDGRIYRVWPGAEVHSAISQFLDKGVTLDKRSGTVSYDRFRPKTTDTRDLLTFLRDGLAIGEDVDPPIWLDTGVGAGRLMAFKNKIVDLLTGEEVTPTSALWIHQAVGYEWDAEARAPTWERFLGEVFPDDPESAACVEEQLGLAMTEDVGFEKGLMLIGPTRSGKSTITSVASALVGTSAYVSLDANKWLSKDTSGEVLIGKRLGVFEDMRLKPGKWYGPSYDPGGLDHVGVEHMLKLTAGNPVTLARKWIKDWEGMVPIHLWIVSNEVPVLNDRVLPGRFVKLAFEQCFLGREDVTLKAKLRAELPGIAQRAVRAYRAAKARGRLIQPEAGLALRAEVDANADPFTRFVGEWIAVDGNATVRCGEVWTKFELWCAKTGNGGLLRSISDGSKLTKKLKKVPGLASLSSTSNHPREYIGLRLKTKEERQG